MGKGPTDSSSASPPPTLDLGSTWPVVEVRASCCWLPAITPELPGTEARTAVRILEHPKPPGERETEDGPGLKTENLHCYPLRAHSSTCSIHSATLTYRRWSLLEGNIPTNSTSTDFHASGTRSNRNFFVDCRSTGTISQEVVSCATSPASLVAALVSDQSPPANRVRTNTENAPPPRPANHGAEAGRH